MEAVVADLTTLWAAPTTVKPADEATRIANAGRFACYVIRHWRDLDDKGRTKLEKANHFAEYHCGLPLDRHPIRYKRGPSITTS